MGFMIAGFVAASFAVIAYCGHCDIVDREEAEREAFERRRAERQAVFDRHAQEVARACLKRREQLEKLKQKRAQMTGGKNHAKAN